MKRDISKLVKTQLPSFVNSEYPLFVKLLEYYYQFNSKNQLDIPLEDVRNPSKTKEQFKELLVKEFGYGLPLEIINSDKFDEDFIMMLKDLYSKKGTDEAFYELFDKILPLIVDENKAELKSDIQLDRPFDRVLRVSHGEWITNSSIFVKIAKGYEDIETIDLSVDYAIHTSRLTGKTTRFIPYKIDKAIYYNGDNLGTINVTKDFQDNYLQIYTMENIDFQVGDVVNIFYKNNIDIITNLVSNTTRMTIEDPGTNFKIGDLLFVDINDIDGKIYKGLVIRVKNVDENGGILEYDIMNFGIDIPYDEIIIDVSNKINDEEQINIYTKPNNKKGRDVWITIKHKFNLFSDYGTLTLRKLDTEAEEGKWFGWEEKGFYNFEEGLFYYEKYDDAQKLPDENFLGEMEIIQNEFYRTSKYIYVAMNSGIWIGNKYNKIDDDWKDEYQTVSGIMFKRLTRYYKLKDSYINFVRNFGDWKDESLINGANDFDQNLGRPGFLDRQKSKNAKFKISNEAIAKYSGFYKNNLSLLDEISKIQDGGENNQYGYVVYSENDPDLYNAVMNKITHPIGTIRFNKKIIYDAFFDNVKASSAVQLGDRIMKLYDLFELFDRDTDNNLLFAKHVIKPLFSDILVFDPFDRIFHGIRERYELLNVYPTHFEKQLTKRFYDNLRAYKTVFDKKIEKSLFSEIPVYESIHKNLSKPDNIESINIKDKIILGKYFVDKISVNEEINKSVKLQTVNEKLKLLHGGLVELIPGLSGDSTYWKTLDKNGYDYNMKDEFLKEFGDIKIEYKKENYYFGFTEVENPDTGKPYKPFNMGVWFDGDKYKK